MSVTTLFDQKASQLPRNTGRTGSSPSGWVRPVQWLPLPDTTGQQMFAGLYLIARDGNFVSLQAAGNYTVDWGDGTSTNHNSATFAQKKYNYADIPATGESDLGYRQVVITVRPQAGRTLTSLNLSVRHNQTGLNTAYGPLWLDLDINSSTLTSLTIGSSGVIVLPALRQVRIRDHAVTNMSNLFGSCPALVSVPLFNTAAVTDMSGMFRGTNGSSLASVPLFNTASVTNMSLMFATCTSLAAVPLFNTSSVTNMQQMFQGCRSLKTVPLFNTASVTNMSGMFNACTALVNAPLFNTAAVTSTSNMFNSCSSLVNVPLFNTTAATDMSGMFAGCSSLTSVPAMTAAAATTLGAVASGDNLSWFAMTSLNATITFASQKLSKSALDLIFTNLLRRTVSTTITISGNYGADTAVSKTACGTTVGSRVVTQTNTASLAVGMRVLGTGVTDAVSVTFQDAENTVTRTAHGLDNGTIVSFTAITSTTGILTYTQYYVVNATTDTFQLAATAGGSAIDLTTNGSGTMIYPAYITAITTNTSFTMSAPASAAGSVTLTARILDTFPAIAKGWTVSG